MSALTSQFCGQSLQRSAVAPAMQQSAAAREWWPAPGANAWRWRSLARSPALAHWFVAPAPPPAGLPRQFSVQAATMTRRESTEKRHRRIRSKVRWAAGGRPLRLRLQPKSHLLVLALFVNG